MEAGDRSLREKQHQSIWEAGNPNKAKEGRLCSKEKDEEVIEYFMEDRYVHANPRITNLNSTIVKKVNVMQNLMFEYDEETAVEADDSMRKMTLIEKPFESAQPNHQAPRKSQNSRWSTISYSRGAG